MPQTWRWEYRNRSLTNPILLYLIYLIQSACLGNGIKCTVFSLGNIPESLLLIGQDTLFTHHFIVLDHQSGDMIAGQSPDKEIVFPFRNVGTGIKRHATGRKDRIPIVDGLFEAFFLLDGWIAHRIATVFETIGNDRPTIVCPGLNPVQLITSLGTKFIVPQISGFRMKCQALYVSVPVTINFR